MNPIILPVAELKPVLTGLSKVINKRTTLPVLGCVRVSRTRTGARCPAIDKLQRAAVFRPRRFIGIGCDGSSSWS